MKFKLLIIVIILLICNISYAGCSSDGKCLIQFNRLKDVEKFINKNPNKITGISLRRFHYYIWYNESSKCVEFNRVSPLRLIVKSLDNGSCIQINP